MSRPVISAIVVLAGASVAGGATPAFAQLSRTPRAVTLNASVASGLVTGVVRDDQGQSVSGVAVTAIGTTQAQARTDVNGAFNLPLVPGEYVLRATRDGYVSPYKEVVRIGASARLQRNITITKQPNLPERKVMLAGMTPALTSERTPSPASVSASSQSVKDWYLRHLPRTILRDGGETRKGSAHTDIKYLPSFLDWVVAESAQAATSFFADTHFSGQINVLTSSAISSSQGWLPDRLPRGIAYLAVGAPVGVHGDWRLRGALSTGGLASWVGLAEYEARPARSHAFRVAMSYGMQRAADDFGVAMLKTSDSSRSVASLDVRDQWRVQPGFELDYGLRLDRYDYVAGRGFVSPRIGGRIAVASRTFVTGLVSSAVIAPGANEFLPPPSAGPWLPPERTFSALVGSRFRPERIHRYEGGLEREFGTIGQTHTVGVRWFHEDVRNQMTTMFGLTEGGAVGHYFVATPGDVTVEGWAVRLSGQFTSRVKASMDYSLSRASWEFGGQSRAIARAMPSAVRPSSERLHDLTSTLEAMIPETETNLTVAYRLNSAFTREGSDGISPIFDGRFDVQLRQALPYQPISGGRIDLLVSVSNLFRDPRNPGSFFDELLTVRTPRRVLGGVQVRF